MPEAACAGCCIMLARSHLHLGDALEVLFAELGTGHWEERRGGSERQCAPVQINCLNYDGKSNDAGLSCAAAAAASPRVRFFEHLSRGQLFKKNQKK